MKKALMKVFMKNSLYFPRPTYHRAAGRAKRRADKPALP
jgi:hypothetical protein